MNISWVNRWNPVRFVLGVPVLQRVLLLALTGWLLAFVTSKALNVAGGSDSFGYLSNAKMMTEGRLTMDIRPIGELDLKALPLWAYQPVGYVPRSDWEGLNPTYPFGFSVPIAFFSLFLPSEGAVLLVMLGACLAIPFLVYFLGREFELSDWWALVPAFAVALSPTFLFMSMAAMSDVFTLLLSLVTMLLAKRGTRHFGCAVALGATLSLLVATRLPNVLLAIPVAVIVFTEFGKRQWLWVILAGLPGTFVLMYVNNALYGAPWRQGYQNIWALFGAEYFFMTVQYFGYWLGVLMTPVVGVAFLGSAFLFRGRAQLVGPLWAWFLPMTLFYCFYSVSHSVWWYTRFILPAFPALAIGGALVLQSLSDGLESRLTVLKRWAAIPVAALAMVVAWEYHWTEKLVTMGPRIHDSYWRLSQWFDGNLPEGVPVACSQVSGTVLYYTDNPVFRFDQLGPDGWGIVREEMRRLDRPIFATLFYFEVENPEVFGSMIPGDWEKVAELYQCTVFRLDP